jgi:PAS domain S-box-containing protein
MNNPNNYLAAKLDSPSLEAIPDAVLSAGFAPSENDSISFNNNETKIEFGNVIDFLPQGVRIVNTDFTVRYANPSFSKLSGLDLAKILGKRCYDTFPSPFCHTSRCSLLRAIKGEKSIQVEIERISVEGILIPCIVSAFPMYDENQKLVAVMESFRDVTDKKILQDKVKEAEDRYKAIVELSGEVGEGIMMLEDIKDEEGVIVFASSQCCRITGYTRKELLCVSFFDLIQTHERSNALQRHRLKMKGKSMPGLYEVSMVRKDGSKIAVELTSAITNYQGRPANVVYLRDISERKRLESQLAQERDRARTYLDIAKVIIIALDERNEITLINQEGCDILGYASEEITGKDFVATCIPRKYQQDVISTLRCVMAEQYYPDDYYENPIKTRAGRNRIIRWHMTPMKGKDGEVNGVLASGCDVTRLRQAEAKIMKYQSHLEELVEQRTRALDNQIKQRVDFTRTLVHELKTPLTSIMSSSEVLSGELKDEALIPLAENIYKSGKNLDRRIADLLDLAKSEIGTLKIKPRLLDPARLLNNAYDKLSADAAKKGHNIVVEVADYLPFVEADDDRIGQVLFNLISNAIKYNKKRGKIYLRAFFRISDVIFEIEDEGIGISPSEQNKLFNPYYRIESDRERFDGLGLGLALSKTLVEMHKGRIWVSSQKGKGSTFAFSLPSSSRSI